MRRVAARQEVCSRCVTASSRQFYSRHAHLKTPVLQDALGCEYRSTTAGTRACGPLVKRVAGAFVDHTVAALDMIYAGLDNFYISKDELASDNPSRRDGISEEVETELRNFGTTLIQEGGCLLDLPEVVPATGQVLFHRFFCKESMAKFDVEVRLARNMCPGSKPSQLWV